MEVPNHGQALENPTTSTEYLLLISVANEL